METIHNEGGMDGKRERPRWELLDWMMDTVNLWRKRWEDIECLNLPQDGEFEEREPATCKIIYQVNSKQTNNWN